jgi:hypothetical protein
MAMLLQGPRIPVYPFWRCVCKVPADERECEGPTSSAPILESSSILTVLLTRKKHPTVNKHQEFYSYVENKGITTNEM